jgi:hypothetical protein
LPEGIKSRTRSEVIFFNAYSCSGDGLFFLS